MSEVPPPPPPPPPKTSSKKTLLLVAVIIVVIAVAAFVVYWFFFGGGGVPSFEELWGKASEYKVVYDFKTESSGSSMTGTFTLAVKGDKTKILISAQNIEILMVRTSKGAFQCMRQKGGPWRCMGTILPGKKSELEIREIIEESKSKFEYEGTRTVLGETCHCWRGTVEVSGGTQETLVCLSGDGIPLYMEGKFTKGGTVVSSSVWTATSVSRTVSDDEFKPPAAPKKT